MSWYRKKRWKWEEFALVRLSAFSSYRALQIGSNEFNVSVRLGTEIVSVDRGGYRHEYHLSKDGLQ